MGTTYHVQHRYGFVGAYDGADKIVVDCRDAAIFSRIGAVRLAAEINAMIGELDRKAHPVMLTSTGKVRVIRGGGR